MLFGATSLTLAQYSSYYYQKAEECEREANEHYQRAQRYAQQAANCRRQADNLSRQNR